MNTLVIKKCLTCSRELEVASTCTEEDLHYSCPDCDPSTETDKYEWYDYYDQWSYVNSFYKCETCGYKISACKYRCLDLSVMCPHCDPSTDTKKYTWSKEDREWNYAYSVYTCPACKGEVKTDGEFTIFMCPNCDPSSPQEKYIWDEDCLEWIHVYNILECQMCNKELHLYYDYREIKIDFKRYKGCSWAPSTSNIIHGYNCLTVATDKVRSEKVQKMYIHDNGHKTTTYREVIDLPI